MVVIYDWGLMRSVGGHSMGGDSLAEVKEKNEVEPANTSLLVGQRADPSQWGLGPTIDPPALACWEDFGRRWTRERACSKRPDRAPGGLRRVKQLDRILLP